MKNITLSILLFLVTASSTFASPGSAIMERTQKRIQHKKDSIAAVQKMEEERQHQENLEMQKMIVPAAIIGGFLFLGIIFYGFITNGKKSQQNINIYNDRKQ